MKTCQCFLVMRGMSTQDSLLRTKSTSGLTLLAILEDMPEVRSNQRPPPDDPGQKRRRRIQNLYPSMCLARRRSFLCEERLFSACHQRRSVKTVTRKELKVEDSKWNPVIDQDLQNFLDAVEHKAGWRQYHNGHAQVANRANCTSNA